MDLQHEIAAIRAAHDRIRPFAHRTPIFTSQRLDALWGASFFFKCEMFQKAGVAKARGTLNAVHSLDDKAAARGVITVSDGNHAGALAMAAHTRRIPCYLVMSDGAPTAKRDAALHYGAQITTCAPTAEARQAALDELVAQCGGQFVHASDDDAMIYGQATAAVELLEDVDDLDIIICPVGGGALLAGTALATKATRPGMQVQGAEPADSDDAWRAFTTGVLTQDRSVHTIADALCAPLSERTFQIMMAHTDAVLQANETSIIEAMGLLWETLKVLVEPAAATPFAALLDQRPKINKRIGVILSGGNVNLSRHRLAELDVDGRAQQRSDRRQAAEVQHLLTVFAPPNQN